MGEWIPIESAPMDGSEIILGAKDSGSWSGWWCDSQNFWGEKGWHDESDRGGGFYSQHPSNPSHWMPLPEPPK